MNMVENNSKTLGLQSGKGIVVDKKDNSHHDDTLPSGLGKGTVAEMRTYCRKARKDYLNITRFRKNKGYSVYTNFVLYTFITLESKTGLKMVAVSKTALCNRY